MGNGTDAKIDTLSIDIVTNVNEKSAERVQAIATALGNLQTVLASGWDNLDDIVNKINKLGTINQTSFSQFNQSLQTVTSGITNLQQVASTPLQTEQGRLLAEYDLVSKKIEEIGTKYQSLSNVIEKTGDISVSKFEAQIKGLVDLERAGAKITGAQIEGLTQEQLNLLLDIERSGTSLSNIQLEQEASTKRLIGLYRQFDGITNKLTGNMQRTSQVDLASAFNEQKNALREVTAEYNTLAKTLGVLSPEATQMAVQIGLGNQELKQLGEQLTQLDPTQTEKVANATFRYDEVLRRINVNQTVAANRATELGKATDFAGKSAIKGSSAFDKLVLSIKRITFYRIVRRAIQLIGKEIVGAIGNFAQFDDETNQAISGLQSSWKAFGNSIGIVASQLINTIAPFLIFILRLATDVANAISLIFATISGEEYYSKAIEYETNYREQLEKTNKQLLGFDRFNVLEQTTAVDPSEMFATEEVATAWAEMSIQTELLLAGITALFAPAVITGLANLAGAFLKVNGAISATSIVANLLVFSGIFVMIFALFELITKWDELSTGMKAFYFILASVGALITAVGIAMKVKAAFATALAVANSKAALATLKLNLALGATLLAIGAIAAATYIFANWDNFTEGTKRAITIIATLTLALITAAIAAMALMGTLTTGIAIPLIIAGIAAGAVAIRGIVGGVTFFADGGIPDTRGGSAFVMNEDGNPELIHENSKGQVQISNQESLRSAFLSALRQHEMEKQSRGQEVTVSVELQPNGNALARALNPYIRQENVRTGR